MKATYQALSACCVSLALAAGCTFSPETAGSQLDCANGRPCPAGWVCPSTGEPVCVPVEAGGDAAATVDGGVRPDGGATPDGSTPTDDGGPGDGGGPRDGGTLICADDCPKAGAAACTGEKAYHLCGEFDGDGCLDWGEIVQCAAGCADGSCGGCAVACAGKECGGDGCGGSCGSCRSAPPPGCTDARTLRTWSPDGSCINDACTYTPNDTGCYFGCSNGKCQQCTPDCVGKTCGDNGCGEPCGQCVTPPQNSCADANTLREYDKTGACGATGACAYTPRDRACPYGCASGTCVNCTPSCAGKECGSDGCGGDCGSCGVNESCAGTLCECFKGFADCNGGADGCETDTRADPANCGGCGAACNAQATCKQNACACDADYASCNGTFNDGCERHLGDWTNDCPAAQDLGGVCGDSGADHLGPFAGHDAKWLKVRVKECSNWDSDLSVYATLASPADADYDLTVRRWCSPSPVNSSALGPGATDTLHEYQSDGWGSTDDFDLVIEIRYKTGSGTSSCTGWTLDVYGNR